MLIAIHIPKTAGTSFMKVLQSIYSDTMVYDYFDEYNFIDTTKPDLRQRLYRLHKKIFRHRHYRTRIRKFDKCLYGHFRANKYLGQFPDAQMVTWVRDPVERVVSHYYHWLREPDFSNTICTHLHRNRLSLREFSSLKPMSNLQSSYLNGVPLDRIDLICITEQFERSIAKFYELIHYNQANISVVQVRSNAMKKVGELYDIDEATRQFIKDQNKEDLKLYEQALIRFEK